MGEWGQTQVPAEGPQTSKIIFVGEAPGAKEEELGRPFVGSAGRVLEDLMRECGVERSECYLTNVVKYRPKGNDFQMFYEAGSRKPVLINGIAEVNEEIMRIRPNLVVLLGNEPLKCITGKTGITKLRGSLMTVTMPNGLEVKCLATYHPAAVLRNWEFRPVALFDMQRAHDESAFPELNLRQRTLVTNPSYTEVITELTRLQSSEYVSFDIETETDQITCVGFSDNASWGICVPFWYGASGSLWSKDQELEIWDLIKTLLEGPTKKIAQNAQYDCTMLADIMDIHVDNLWMDTMVAGHLCYPELPKGLDFLTSICTDQPYYKDWIREGDMEKYWKYNCLDACCTFEVAFEVKKELEGLDMWGVYNNYLHKLIAPLMAMSRRGVKIDLPIRKVAIKQYRENIVTAQGELDTLVGHELNVSSPKQMKKWLYEEIGFKAKFKRGIKNGRTVNTITADEEAITEIARTSPRREFDLVLEIRALKKVLSTYLEARLDPDGRIRTTYLITGTETGRLSSRESVHGTGTNLQNVPKGIARRLFIPDGENIFVSADLSQAEARVVAYLAGEDNLIRLFESGGDIHRRNAANIFRVSEASVTDKQRQLAKRVVHASNYGMGPLTFAKQAGIPLHEAKRLLNANFATYPGIKIWQMKTVSQLNKSRMLSTPFGRKRLFMGTFNESLKKAAYAYVPQSTVSDMLNSGLLLLSSQLRTIPGAELLLQVHDSVVVQCSPTAMAEVCIMIKRVLEQPIDITGVDSRIRTCKIPCDIQVGWNWDQLEKITSPYTTVPERRIHGS